MFRPLDFFAQESLLRQSLASYEGKGIFLWPERGEGFGSSFSKVQARGCFPVLVFLISLYFLDVGRAHFVLPYRHPILQQQLYKVKVTDSGSVLCLALNMNQLGCMNRDPAPSPVPSPSVLLTGMCRFESCLCGSESSSNLPLVRAVRPE